jgi:hypothetical protein
MEVSIKNLSFISTFSFSLLLLTQCSNETGTLESILNEYIAFYKLNKSEHYMHIGIGKWSDSTAVLTINFKYINKDKLLLPKEVLKSSYKGINMYFSDNLELLTLSNMLKFEKIITKQEDREFEAHNEYSNDIQIVYCLKGDCIMYLLEGFKESKTFDKIFKEKGLMCQKCSND